MKELREMLRDKRVRSTALFGPAFLIFILLVYAGLDIAFYAGVLAGNGVVPTRALIGAVDLLMVLMLAIGGRVIPFFTGRRLAGHVMWQNKYVTVAVNVHS